MTTTKKENLKDQWAVIKTGGKQYLVSSGDKIKIEKIKGDFKVGDKIIFDQVLLAAQGSEINLGTPYLKDAKVEAELLSISRAPKVTVIKYKAKSRYFKKRGHRQPYFEVKIVKI